MTDVSTAREVKATLLELVGPDQHAHLLALVEATVSAVPEMAGRYSESELDQLVRAFAGVLREALEGDSREGLDLLVGTAVPAFIADGQTTSSLARAAGTFSVVVSSSLLESVPEAQRTPASAWLANFFGEYTQAIIETAMRVEAER